MAIKFTRVSMLSNMSVIIFYFQNPGIILIKNDMAIKFTRISILSNMTVIIFYFQNPPIILVTK